MPVYLLVDNGSKQPDATLYLRCLAAQLSEHTGKKIHPVSLQHSNAISAAELAGTPADVFHAFLRAQLDQGEREFVVVPLFFGVSRAITSFIPDEVSELQAEFPDFTVKVAPVIWPLPEGEPRLAQIVSDHIRQATEGSGSDNHVVLVDHGSPTPAITEVRRHIARMLEEQHAMSVGQAVMERREGKEYDFNGELLASWLAEQAGQGVDSIIVAMLFFLPGRHAGPRGDVQKICDNVVKDYPRLNYVITPLISSHPLLLDILRDRLEVAEQL
ncbi:sirohydrochlorin chelatase [Thiohalophilus sp.]|uniref:sirohydrochlorin chelatase n=1 Tax=Thiohalophilus sp. TaxID=3028392 RepID=UPI0039769EF5